LTPITSPHAVPTSAVAAVAAVRRNLRIHIS
jgi:hypothetical protein